MVMPRFLRLIFRRIDAVLDLGTVQTHHVKSKSECHETLSYTNVSTDDLLLMFPMLKEYILNSDPLMCNSCIDFYLPLVAYTL